MTHHIHKILCVVFIIQLAIIFSASSGSPESVSPTPKGRVMVLEYHKIDYPEAAWTRTPENFRKDLQRFYDKGYQLIRMDDFLENSIRVNKGKTPLILTFDDSSPGQLRFLPDGKGGYRVDPNCAVGILESFYATHPDFGLAAIFYVLPAANPPNKLFNQPEYAQEKLRYLVRKGFEIGNHTLWHATLSKQSPEGVRRQLALAVKAIQEAVPGYQVKSLSLPMGIYPKDTGTLLNGSYEGVSYQHKGVMMVTGGPAVPPSDKSYNPLRIPRIQAIESELNYWLRYFDKHPEERYTGQVR
ncbi:MAG: polysaccharide deacetylase family protein [Nitrospirae bacterium]|nr:polysaccharide deacetylase family protein [Nitrospirota bacterium]